MPGRDPAPELAPLTALTSDERQAWSRALARHQIVRHSASHLSTGLACAVLFVISLFACMLLGAAVWMVIGFFIEPNSDSPYEFPGSTALAVLIAISVVFSAWIAIRTAVRLQRLDHRRHMLIHLRARRAVCAGCGYDLSGVAGPGDRPAIVRCPECALTNPGLMPSALSPTSL